MKLVVALTPDFLALAWKAVLRLQNERAATVFLDPRAMSRFDLEHSADEERWITLGLDGVRILLVVLPLLQRTSRRPSDGANHLCSKIYEVGGGTILAGLNPMKKEYDFSKAERGKFFRKAADLRLPIYLDSSVQTRVEQVAEKTGEDVGQTVNRLLRKDLDLIEEAS